MKKIAALMVCLQAASWGMESSRTSSSFETQGPIFRLKLVFSSDAQTKQQIERIERRSGLGYEILNCLSGTELRKHSDIAKKLFEMIDVLEHTGMGDPFNTNHSIAKAAWEWSENPLLAGEKEKLEALLKKKGLSQNASASALKEEAAKIEAKSDAPLSYFGNCFESRAETTSVKTEESIKEKRPERVLEDEKRSRQLESELAKEQQNFRDACAKSKALECDITRLENEIQTLKPDLEKARADCDSIFQVKETLQQDLTKQKEELMNLQEDYRNKIYHLEAELKMTKERSDRQTTIEGESLKREQELKAKISTLENENNVLQNQYAQAQAKIQQLDKIVKIEVIPQIDRAGLIEALENSLLDSEKKREALEESLRNVESENKKLKEEHDMLRQQLASQNHNTENQG